MCIIIFFIVVNSLEKMLHNTTKVSLKMVFCILSPKHLWFVFFSGASARRLEETYNGPPSYNIQRITHQSLFKVKPKLWHWGSKSASSFPWSALPNLVGLFRSRALMWQAEVTAYPSVRMKQTWKAAVTRKQEIKCCWHSVYCASLIVSIKQ